FLPPYSPELNPIEKLWANLKRWLKFNLCFFDIFDDAVSFYFQVN
ncbi:MAG: transposase, partial [Ruminococcus sp.]|nr:transposase [Ruminococcus sp.]MBP3761101.1 transposase [Ruminococcus sp.]